MEPPQVSSASGTTDILVSGRLAHSSSNEVCCLGSPLMQSVHQAAFGRSSPHHDGCVKKNDCVVVESLRTQVRVDLVTVCRPRGSRATHQTDPNGSVNQPWHPQIIGDVPQHDVYVENWIVELLSVHKLGLTSPCVPPARLRPTLQTNPQGKCQSVLASTDN